MPTYCPYGALCASIKHNVIQKRVVHSRSCVPMRKNDRLNLSPLLFLMNYL